MGCVYTVLWFIKALWIVLSETNILRNLQNDKLPLVCSWELYDSLCTDAPSSDHSLLTLNLPCEVIVRKFEVVFWFLEWECCTFEKINENSFQSTNTILWLCCKKHYEKMKIDTIITFS